MSALTKKNYNYDHEEDKNRQIKKKRVIKKKKKNTINLGVIKNLFFVIAVFCLGITIVYNYSTITEKKMQIQNLNDEITSYDDKINQYNIAIESKLNNTNNIEILAKNYLGMNYPTRKQTVFLDVTYDKVDETLKENSNEKIMSFIDKALNLFR